MDTVFETNSRDYLPLSLRLLRLTLGVLLIAAIITEISLSKFWQITFSILAFYTLTTGVFGRDPLFCVLRLSNRQMPDHTLGLVAQLECLSIGVICIVAGILNRGSDSLILQLLPFLGH